ncbi:MAG: hypothetical protein FJY67_11760 [Calditrichaeota bacterium]|nr:hypothetical protein [Calditrichota bacterium]
MSSRTNLSLAALALLAVFTLFAAPSEAWAVDFTVYVYEDGPDPVQNAAMKARFLIDDQWTDWLDPVEGPNPGEYHWEIPEEATDIQIGVPSYLEPVSPSDPVVELPVELMTLNWEVIDNR